MSFIGIVVLALPMLVIALIIKADVPGPALFRKKRVGIKKNEEVTYFSFLKFRSIKMSTPNSTPIHMLKKPEQYITRIGAVLRKTSGDGLPLLFRYDKVGYHTRHRR